MQPTQMTRAEYQAKYGVAPVSSSSDLDITPAPIRMTRAEYNALYRPQEAKPAPLRDRLADIGQGVQQTASQAIAGEGEFSGQSPLERGTQAVAAYSGVVPRAAYEMLPGFIRKPLDFVGEKVAQGFQATSKALSETDLIKGAAGRQEIDPETGAVTYVENDLGMLEPAIRTTAAGGEIAGNILAAEGARYTLEKAPVITKELVTRARNVTDSFANSRQDARVAKVADEIEGIETKYAPTRRKADLDPNVQDSRVRIAQSNVLENAVDTDGLIRTKGKDGALEAYRKQTIDGVEDVVRKNLEIEGKKMNLNELKKDMMVAVTTSGLEGADLVRALKGIDNEIKGLAVRSDEFGDVLLSKIQDAKISTTKHIDYTKPTGVTYRKTLARVYKEAIENKSDFNVKEVNQELAKYYKDLDRIADLDGKRVKGGRLGKYTSQLAGTALGGVAGAAGGAPGAVVGGILSGEVAATLTGRAMSRTFKTGVRGDIPENVVLKDAKAKAAAGVKDLKNADPQVGAPDDLLRNPNLAPELRDEMVKTEGLIKQNIKQQNAAIKAGDFTLVAALKDVYNVLVERLSETIKTAKENLVSNKNLYRDRNSNQRNATTAPNNANAIKGNVTKTVAKNNKPKKGSVEEGAIADIKDILESSEGGVIGKNYDGSYVRTTSYPQWVPKEYRDQTIIRPVMKHFEEGTKPRSNAYVQAELYDIIKEQIDARKKELLEIETGSKATDGVVETVDDGFDTLPTGGITPEQGKALQELAKRLNESSSNSTPKYLQNNKQAGFAALPQKKVKITPDEKRLIAQALEEYDTAPMTVKVNGKSVIADTAPDADVRLLQLKTKNADGVFTDADAKEALLLLRDRGALGDLAKPKTTNLTEQAKGKTLDAFVGKYTKANTGDTYDDLAQFVKEVKRSDLEKGGIQMEALTKIKEPSVRFWKEKIVAGERPPIVVKDMKIVDGNHRYTAYKELGEENIPVLFENSYRSQLEDIWKNANSSDLVEEARKYESAFAFRSAAENDLSTAQTTRRAFEQLEVMANATKDKQLNNLKGGTLEAVLRDNPSLGGNIPETVTVYRAGDGTINEGQFVSLEKSVAQQIADGRGGKMAEIEVPTTDLQFANSDEFFYVPQDKIGFDWRTEI